MFQKRKLRKLNTTTPNVHGKKTLNREDTTQYVGFLLCDMENSREYFCDGYALNIERLNAFTQIPERTLRKVTEDLREHLKRRRDIVIGAMAANGMTHREIAQQIGATQPTVSAVIKKADKKWQAAEIYQDDTQSPPKSLDNETTTSSSDESTPPWLQDLPVIDDDMDEGLPEDFDAKLEALQEHDQKGWNPSRTLGT